MTGDHAVHHQPTVEQQLEVFRGLAHPVVIVTGRDLSGEPVGLTVSSFTSVSLTPPLVLFCPSVTSRAWATARTWGAFAVNVLDRRQADLAARFSRPGPRFAGTPTIPADDGVPLLADALTALHCEIDAEHPAGDHMVVIGRIHKIHEIGEGSSLDTATFRQLQRRRHTKKDQTRLS
jgi:3-hydroxy-9,10-secoandrosta-1,3,5(10)-triene-9,17-dione monooxygenase reductase component